MRGQRAEPRLQDCRKGQGGRRLCPLTPHSFPISRTSYTWDHKKPCRHFFFFYCLKRIDCLKSSVFLDEKKLHLECQTGIYFFSASTVSKTSLFPMKSKQTLLTLLFLAVTSTLPASFLLSPWHSLLSLAFFTQLKAG